MQDADTKLGGGRSKFPETRLTALAAASSPEPHVREDALHAIVSAYWKPVYKHIRIHWRKSNEDSKDLTQGFFAKVIEKEFLASYDPSRSAFRTYLRMCLDAFVANEEQSARRLKRGGGAIPISLDFEAAEGEMRRLEPQARVLPAEDLFYQEWARSLFAIAVERLRSVCEAKSRSARFELFRRYDLAEERPAEVTYDSLGTELGMNAATVTNNLAAARRDFRRIVLQTLREMTCSEAEYRAEARRLLGAEVGQ